MPFEEKLYSDQREYGTSLTHRKALASCDQQNVMYVIVLQQHVQINWRESSYPIMWR